MSFKLPQPTTDGYQEGQNKQTNKNLFMSLHDLPLPLNSRSMIYEDMTRVITYMQHIYPKAFLEIIVTNVWET